MANSELQVRRAVESDLATIQALNKELYDYENARGFYDDSYDLAWTYSEAGTRYFAGLLKADENNSVAFVAFKDDHAIGYLAASLSNPTYRSQKPIAEIDNMFVIQNHRSAGVGSALVNEFMGWAKAVGALRAKVGAFSENSATAFYRKCGFHDHEIVFEKKL